MNFMDRYLVIFGIYHMHIKIHHWTKRKSNLIIVITYCFALTLKPFAEVITVLQICFSYIVSSAKNGPKIEVS